MKNFRAEICINGKVATFTGTFADLETLLRQPNVSWSYKYIHGSDGYLNICSDADGRFHVGWGLSPRQNNDDWEWINDHPYATYDFDSLSQAIEYAEKY